MKQNSYSISNIVCFSKELNINAIKCQRCSDFEACKIIQESRKRHVNLLDVEFNFIPHQISDVKVSELDEVTQIYNECYRAVFGFKAEPDNIFKNKDKIQEVKNTAKKLGCTLRLFTACIMAVHKTSNSDKKFYSSILFSETAKDRFLQYKNAVLDKYGSFDLSAYENFTGLTINHYEKVLKCSEEIYASWIIGYKIKSQDDPMESFFKYNELKLDPLWLATNKEYYTEILKYWIGTSSSTTEINKKRFETCKILKKIKNNKKLLYSIFKLKQDIMPEVIKNVLYKFKLKPSDFMSITPVNDSEKFWARIGLAIQHYNCLNWYSTGNFRYIK